MNTFSVTRDSGANLKILLSLQKGGFIKIHDVMLENGRENKKIKEKILPVAVYNYSKWGEAVWGGEDTTYSDIRKIIGRENIKDAMHLEAHIRKAHNYFVTEDRDFLDKREELETKFNIKIVTPVELEKICRPN